MAGDYRLAQVTVSALAPDRSVTADGVSSGSSSSSAAPAASA